MGLLLALLSAGWIARGLAVAQYSLDVWWLWAGVPTRPEGAVARATTLLDPVLGLGCLFAVVAVQRRAPSAPRALSAVAVATLLFREPPLWSLGADGLPGAGGTVPRRWPPSSARG
ncbi:hypothetical protein [Streptomyces sp. Ac-502]|uniref:hypothetical protein n=1 Tax=Streptomyces sp. Ac-502 TaxID=3342801 RepID=UPI0038625222